ncbi:fumarate reductase cytochrome b subunit [Pseudomaricurvus sp. HS19]|uniref:fumarate reductase cytochrome b subunit n=1 Tax=Pseudomaricurvus sp. HS19 TaxID=2692626 RepID=UPI00136FA29A|nr:fumarate reductase cytochrome b subunit [Pseudomaricurvus sp. HS19]MYM61877.1 fumarate reductase cytochrome b subunit [Pseudomaricurvus sp. HS19]
MTQPLTGRRPSRLSAWMDMVQGGTGLLLVLFMWAHMLMVSSILLGKDAMYWVARMFEGEPLLGKPYPILVSGVVLFILAAIVVHAVLALRRFPASSHQYQTLHHHIRSLRHGDTTLWYLQVITGFALFFLASVHLYQMLLHPGDIGPYASSDRVWSGRFWPLYLLLLFAVELHGGIGVYRLVVKWGWFLGKDPRRGRRRLQRIKWLITAFLLALGLLTLAAYMKIGMEHEARVGERYVPAHLQPVAEPQGNP